MIGIIGGSGLYEGMRGLEAVRDEHVETPFGAVDVVRATLSGRDVVFLSRHGRGERRPPHTVAYKAHVEALHRLGVRRVLATSAVGSLDEAVPLGTLVLPDQFIDRTTSVRTFYEGGASGVLHLDLSEPFCPATRETLAAVGREQAADVRSGGTYVCIDGPHFETRAEARMLVILGGTLAGMTAVPESKLCREREICYQVIAIPVDYPGGSGHAISHANTLEVMQSSLDRVADLIASAVLELPETRTCVCATALEGAQG